MIFLVNSVNEPIPIPIPLPLPLPIPIPTPIWGFLIVWLIPLTNEMVGGAWLFLMCGMACLVNSVNERDKWQHMTAFYHISKESARIFWRMQSQFLLEAPKCADLAHKGKVAAKVLT